MTNETGASPTFWQRKGVRIGGGAVALLAAFGIGANAGGEKTPKAAPAVTTTVVSTVVSTATTTVMPSGSSAKPSATAEPAQLSEDVDETDPTTVDRTPRRAIPQTTQEPAPAAESGGDSVYYKNCDAARAAGAAPIHAGEPGYGSHLDRDGDGIGCDAG